MKRILAVVALGLTLAGCAGFNPFASFKNPFDKPTLAGVESAYGAALSVAVGYRDACAQRLIPPSCRPIVKQIQAYGGKAQAAIVTARNFVRNYPQLDATTALVAAQKAVTDFKDAETRLGVH